MRSLVSAILLTFASIASFAAGIPISAPRLGEMSGQISDPPVIAAGSDGEALVAWTAREENLAVIYASDVKLASAGVPIPRRVAETPDLVSGLLVTHTADGYLVLWRESLRRFIQGSVIGPNFINRFEIEQIDPDAAPLALATSAGRTLLAYRSCATTGECRFAGAYLTQHGAVASSFTIITAHDPIAVSLTAAGDGFLFAYAAEADLRATRVTRIDGTAVSPSIVAGTAPAGGMVRIAASDRSALVVFASPDGVVARHLDLQGRPLSAAFPVTGGSGMSIAWTGEDFALTYGSLALQVEFISENGLGVEKTLVLAIDHPSFYTPAIGSNGEATSLVWLRTIVDQPEFSSIEGIALAGRETAGPRLTVSKSFADQDEPSVARNGDSNLVAWVEKTGGTNPRLDFTAKSVFVAAFDGVHEVSDPTTLTTYDRPRSPAVTATSDGYFLAWIEDSRDGTTSRVLGQFLARDGSVVGDRIILSTAEPQIPTVKAVWNGSEALLLWISDSADFAGGTGLTAARVSSAGGLIERRFSPFGALTFSSQLSVARNSSGLLVTANARVIDGTLHGHNYVYALALDSFGSVIARATIGAEGSGNAGVSAVGDRYLVAWADPAGFMAQYLDAGANAVSQPVLITQARPSAVPSIAAIGDSVYVAADLGSTGHLLMLATIRDTHVDSIALIDDASSRRRPDANLVVTGNGVLSISRHFDDGTGPARLIADTLPRAGDADLMVDLDVAPASASAGSIVTVSVVLRNGSAATANDAGVVLRVPEAIVESVPKGCELAQSFPAEVVCNAKKLAPGGEARFPIRVVLLRTSDVSVAAYSLQADRFTGNNEESAKAVVVPTKRRSAVAR